MASDHNASAIIAVCSVLLAVSFVCIGLRFYARRRQKASFLADDWLVLPAFAAFAGGCAAVYYGVHIKALGYLSTDVTKEQLLARAESSARVQLAFNLATIFSLGLSKASLLFFYKRIFCVAGHQSVFNVIIIASIVVVACWVITFEFLISFQCHTHFSAPWDGTQLKYCNYSYAALLGQAISDFLLDVWVLLLPIYSISKLHTTKTRRFGIAGVFLLGILGLAASIARMVIIVKLTHVGQSAVHRQDPEVYLSRVVFYFYLEAGVSLVAINLPSIWLLFATITPESVIRSIRSVVSLASLGSRRSKGDSPPGSQVELPPKTSLSSSGFHGEGTVTEIHKAHDSANVPAGEIQVSRSVQQTTVPRDDAGV